MKRMGATLATVVLAGSLVTGCTQSAPTVASTRCAPPTGFHADGRQPGTTQVKDIHDATDAPDGEKAALELNQTLGTRLASTAVLDGYLKTLKGDSAAFRQAFLARMDPKRLKFIQQIARAGVEPGTRVKYDEVISAVAQILAKASKDKTQGGYPVPSSFYDGLRSQYNSTAPPQEGHLLLAAIVQAGQAGQDTWDPALLTDITKDAITFEREPHRNNPSRNRLAPAPAGADLAAQLPGRVDAVEMLLDAVGHNADASQDVLRGPDGNADLALLHYLYDGRPGGGRGGVLRCGWGRAFGNVLEQASTNHRGGGGTGTRDYVAAQIASDLVNYAGEKPDERLLPGMEESVVDILTVHMDAVNDLYDRYVVKPGQVIQNYDGYTQALFSPRRLDNVMTTVLRSDYGTAKVEGDAHSGKNPHPLLTQLALAQQVTSQRAVTYAVTQVNLSRDRVLVADDHGWRSGATVDAYAKAIAHEGGSEEAARAVAHEAMGLITVFGIAYGAPGEAGSERPKPIDREGLGTLKSWAIHGWLPEAGAAGRMKNAEVALFDTNIATGSLAYLKWLDDAGKGPTGAASYDSWAAKNPAHKDFLTQGADRHWHIGDLGQIYLDQDTSGGRKAWLDFVKYGKEAGVQWLLDQEFYDWFVRGMTPPRY